MTISKRLLLLCLILASCVGCDQTTKSMAQSYLTQHETWSYLGDTVRLQLTYNHGGFLSLGASLPETWRDALFGVGVAAMLLGLTGYALFARRLPAVGVFALALSIAGGASNLADRLVYGGYVVDFMNLGIGPLRTGVFNVADVFVMAGAGVLLATELTRQARDV